MFVDIAARAGGVVILKAIALRMTHCGHNVPFFFPAVFNFSSYRFQVIGVPSFNKFTSTISAAAVIFIKDIFPVFLTQWHRKLIPVMIIKNPK